MNILTICSWTNMTTQYTRTASLRHLYAICTAGLCELLPEAGPVLQQVWSSGRQRLQHLHVGRAEDDGDVTI